MPSVPAASLPDEHVCLSLYLSVSLFAFVSVSIVALCRLRENTNKIKNFPGHGHGLTGCVLALRCCLLFRRLLQRILSFRLFLKL